MFSLDLQDLAAASADFDAAVLRTPNVDLFCSSSYWVIPALQAFHDDHEPWIYASDDGSMWAVMALGRSASVGRYVAPFESMWGLATPFIGADPGPAADFACAILDARQRDWDALWLSGLQRGTAAFQALVGTFGNRYRLGLGPSTKRHVATLEGGWDAYLGRRTRKFRKNLRRSWRMAQERGLSFERFPSVAPDEVEALYDRILAIEAMSWKGQTDQGINTGSMVEFYRLMLPMLATDGLLRVIVASVDGKDVGYIFGAVFGGTFRGLQVSFHDDYRDMSLGNIMQSQMLQLLCEESGVGYYDLGSDLPYKTRWSEPGLVTETVAVLP